jgi:salicylate hydroxylase
VNLFAINLKMHSSPPNFTPLSVTVVGAGLGGLCAALALRREGHEVVIYEHRDFEGDTGANLGIVSNGTRWLEHWGVDIGSAMPNVLKKLLIHKWDTGEIVSEAATGNYKEKFGFVSNCLR